MPMRRPRVLVIDDDALTRELLALLLADDGYEVRAAADGRAALRLLESWRADLIVLDLVMDGMDGAAFLAEHRRDGIAEIPVLLLSAARGLEDRARGLGVAEALAKPFDLDELCAMVRRLLAG